MNPTEQKTYPQMAEAVAATMTDYTKGSSSLPEPAAALTVKRLAEHVGGVVEGDDSQVIIGIANIEEADFGDIVFAEDSRNLNKATRSRASAILTFLDSLPADKPLIKVENPRIAYNSILELFNPPLKARPGIHPTAVIGRNVKIDETASIGPHVTIEDNNVIGARAIVQAGGFIGEDCELGEDCVLYPNVTLYQGTVIGARTRIHSGTVIGSDGFGYVRIGNRGHKVPHVGNVDIGEDVEIGANCAIDRAKTGSTVIGARTKVDNLVHIAHNVKTGTDCFIVAQVGIAGSTTLGRGVILAGQVGLKDHIQIGDGVTVMAQGGVFGDIEAGAVYSGYPARPHREKMRVEAATNNLPEYVKRIRALEKSNARLEQLVVMLAEKLGIENPDLSTEPDTDTDEGSDGMIGESDDA